MTHCDKWEGRGKRVKIKRDIINGWLINKTVLVKQFLEHPSLIENQIDMKSMLVSEHKQTNIFYTVFNISFLFIPKLKYVPSDSMKELQKF